MPSPFDVVKEFVRLLETDTFFKNIGSTCWRTLESFVIIVVSGIILGLVAGYSRKFEWAVQPLITVFKATPVMSVILIAYLWLDSGKVPVFSAFLMAFPIMFVQVMNGVRGIDKSLAQMCQVYSITGSKKLFNFVLPAIAPSIVTGAKQTLSMIWKVVIAAEVLTIPKHGVGRSLQLSQVNLETSKVFAWTVSAVLLTALGDLIFNFILKKVVSRRIINEA